MHNYHHSFFYLLQKVKPVFTGTHVESIHVVKKIANELRQPSLNDLFMSSTNGKWNCNNVLVKIGNTLKRTA